MEPIAITGIACRLPGAPSLTAYWNMLKEGRDGIGPVPTQRWDADAIFDADPKAVGKTNSRHGGFIENIDYFDAEFFGISPREAVQMDPQQRILMELAYEAFVDAGIASSSLAGSDTSVFIGVMSNDYLRQQTDDGYSRIDVHTGGGAGFCMLANRLSFQFDLHGPSMSIDSACSSSLVSVFQACQTLWTGQSGLALAGGVNLMLDPSFNIFYSKAGLLAPDGRCKTFSAKANGIGRGEGAGLVVLKRLDDALLDGDRIYAVIQGGAINHDGLSNGVTAPNRWAQEKLLRSALKHANVGAEQIKYVELHGTGTYIGDPIEANALGTVLKENGREEPCLVGSVKSNIGHLEGAAGVAGLIKLALSLYYRKIPSSLWFDEPNPVIDFDNLPLKVTTDLTDWTSDSSDAPLFAGISSFGLGGTNAHLILGSASVCKREDPEEAGAQDYFLMLSGRSEEALRSRAKQFYELLGDDVRPVDVCAAALGRSNVFDYRLCAMGHDRSSLRQMLSDYLAHRTNPALFEGRYKPRRQPIRLLVPDGEDLLLHRVSRFLLSTPDGRAIWQSCRQQFLARNKSLPELQNLADFAMPADTASRRLFVLVCRYALLQQLITTLPDEQLTLSASGQAQLAACCAAGALTLEQAVDWMDRSLSAPVPSTASYRIKCDFAGAINPELSDLDWDSTTVADSMKNPESDRSMNLVVNLDGAIHPVSGMHCFGEHKHDFSYLYARLSLVCQLNWARLVDRRFMRLPVHVWQRQSYWLPRKDKQPSRQDDPKEIPKVAANPAPNTGKVLREEFFKLDLGDRESYLVNYLRERVAETLQIPIDKIIADEPLNAMGIDSLTAVEIKGRLEREFRVSIPVVNFLNGFSTADFAVSIIKDMDTAATSLMPERVITPTQEVSHPIKDSPDVDNAIQARIAVMSEEQVDDLLDLLMQEVA